MTHGNRCLPTWLWAAVLLAGCASATPETTSLRSPTRDYQPPSTRDVDGRPLGADNITPEDRLEQGAKVGNENALAPGWTADEEKGLSYDPERRKGGAIDIEPKVESTK